jgi:hypothetical protein
MPALHRLFAPIEAYPHWFVASCAVVAAALALWVLGKLLTWTFYVMLVFVLLALLALAMLFFLGPAGGRI